MSFILLQLKLPLVVVLLLLLLCVVLFSTRVSLHIICLTQISTWCFSIVSESREMPSIPR